MTDLEISRQLALAIGWISNEIHIDRANGWVFVYSYVNRIYWTRFNYQDWTVIGPIAERFGCFPVMRNGQWVLWLNGFEYVEANTPQKAIALAVIAFAGAKK